ncbi:MAG: SPFH/Band 7/PHB domain protein [Clostridiales bacterium]|nr:SPFH/Band 7/PHB domain protein [Clostridiales bacterium]
MFWIILGILVIVTLLLSVKVVNTGFVFVVERFGQFYKVLEPGWHFIFPYIDYVRARVSTKQQIIDIEPQNVITKDNVNISIDNVIFYRVMNARDAVYNIENYKSGIIYSAITNVRNVVGSMTLDDVLTGRDRINKELLDIVDQITDSYGIKILSVEIKDITPPKEIQEAMEKQMRAERDKRAAILQSEGQRQSAISIAEGEKQAKILQAEAEKESNIRRAEGQREAELLEAEGRAKAMMELANAEAEAINLVNRAIIESGTDERVIALKQVEALIKMADSPSSKLILPNESVTSLGSIAAISEMLKLNSEADGKKTS